MILSSDLTPLMRQYAAIKQQYPHTLVLFQVGDFYELFFDDAKKASAYLGITLTKRGKINGDPIPLCGVPVHALDHYLIKLIKGGFKVAICDQLEEARPGKVVERGVTQVLTPGTLTDSRLLEEKTASYLFSFFPAQDQWGLVFAELLTAQLFATVIPANALKSLESEIARFFPDEVIIPDDKSSRTFESYFKKLGYCTTLSAAHDQQETQQWIDQQFDPAIRAQLVNNPAVYSAFSYFHSYMKVTQQPALEQFKTVNWYAPDDFLMIDNATQTNLELVRNAHDGSSKHTLFEVLDGAITPMGSRMIKKWVMRPLVKEHSIVQRQDVIEQVIANIVIMQQLENLLAQVGDVERVIGRIALRRALIGDYIHLKRVLSVLPFLYQTLAVIQTTTLVRAISATFADFALLHQLLTASLNDDPTKEYSIKTGFDQNLDLVRELADGGTQKIMALEAQEQQATGINSLKIRYNNVYGYYIEVTKTHADAIPERYIRQQTLVGRERYVTPELQQLQHDILRAQGEMNQIEKAVFERIKQEVHLQVSQLRKLAHALANLDGLCGLARVSYQQGYTRPLFNHDRQTSISGGRHAVVERVIGHAFIPNDTYLNNEQSTWIITGPNMGGKSTFLRQVALIHILAQIGSYVPAKNANLAILDRIFTRIGAGDNLAQGKSTFLVEMEETAAICSQATADSLVILDEVGRGTSTFDGLAIAQAVVEYIHTVIKSRCLFATHYHELTLLPATFEGMVAYYAASKKTNTGIHFLYTIIAGIADGSFGVEVAKLAELPEPVIIRAQEILEELQAASDSMQKITVAPRDDQTMLLRQTIMRLEHEIKTLTQKSTALQQIDYDNLSPKAAFDILWKIKEL